MKKLSLFMLTICIMATYQSQAQFGKLLGKKDKTKTEETDKKAEEPKKSSGKGSKKTGDFTTVWASEFDNKANVLAFVTQSNNFIIGTDTNSATMLDGEGKQLWSGDYKNLTTNKSNKCEIQYLVHGTKNGYLFLFDKKMGKDKVSILEMASGKELWNSEEYQNLVPKGSNGDEGQGEGELESVKFIDEMDAFLISQKESVILVKANTGEKIWETNRFKGAIGKYIYNKEKNEIVMINYKPTLFGAIFAGFKNQIVRINALNGDVIWDQPYFGFVEKELVTRKAIVDIWIDKGKVFLYLNGLTVYDYATGKVIWKAHYDTEMEARTGRKMFYRTIANPLFTDKAVYLAMEGGRNKVKYVEKYDLETGKLQWTSEKITGAFCMPNMYLAGDKVMVQVGGKFQVQEYRKETKTSVGVGSFAGGSTVEWVPYIYWDYKAQKNSVLALDEKTGTTAWRSEKFDKRITDFVLDGTKTLFVGDGDEFYSYDIKSGTQLFDVKHGDAGVGKATDVIDFNENVVVLSEKGLACYSKKDGKRVYATEKIKGVDYFYKKGENYFLRDQRNSKNIIYGIDMTNGDVKGSVQSKGKGGTPEFGDGIAITNDGEYIFTFQGKKVEKIKVNN
ncbi:PQQ-binding-like beta-propeller repeat protein [Flavobacterium sp.]|uniref:outer membrane protein assembly factor BamB family protein n=1 Tax=Flavobacterium sp. TaxID=239 RepID=UPI003750F70D